VREQINAHIEDEVSTTIISVGELYYGVANSQEMYREQNLAKLEEFVNTVGYVGYSKAAAKHFGEQKARLRKSGQPIPDLDLIIAAIALAEDAVLVTDNVKHFERIPALKLENWK